MHISSLHAQVSIHGVPEVKQAQRFVLHSDRLLHWQFDVEFIFCKLFPPTFVQVFMSQEHWSVQGDPEVKQSQRFVLHSDRLLHWQYDVQSIFSTLFSPKFVQVSMAQEH